MDWRTRLRCAGGIAAVACVLGLPPSQARAQQPAAPAPPTTTVHLRANDPRVGLYQHAGTANFVGVMAAPVGSYGPAVVGGFASASRMMCAPPCDIAVDSNQIYSLGGAAFTSTDEFRLLPGKRAVIDVHAGTKLSRIGGFTLAIIGGLTALSGAGLIAASYTPPGMPSEHPERLRLPGVIVGVAGGGLLVAGVLMAAGGNTTYRIAYEGP
jgi:hypothetical protein